VTAVSSSSWKAGYKVDALHCGILNVFYALLGKDEIIDPLGPMPQSEQDVSDLLLKAKTTSLDLLGKTLHNILNKLTITKVFGKA
jgi:hypothetical protein